MATKRERNKRDKAAAAKRGGPPRKRDKKVEADSLATHTRLTERDAYVLAEVLTGKAAKSGLRDAVARENEIR